MDHCKDILDEFIDEISSINSMPKSTTDKYARFREKLELNDKEVVFDVKNDLKNTLFDNKDISEYMKNKKGIIIEEEQDTFDYKNYVKHVCCKGDEKIMNDIHKYADDQKRKIEEINDNIKNKKQMLETTKQENIVKQSKKKKIIEIDFSSEDDNDNDNDNDNHNDNNNNNNKKNNKKTYMIIVSSDDDT